MILLLSLLTITTLCGWGYALYLRHQLALKQQEDQQQTHWQTEQHQQQEKLAALQQTYLNAQQQHAFALQDHLTRNMRDIREQLSTTLKQHAASFDTPLKRLADTVEKRLESISQQVAQRLEVGFDKTTALFTDVVKRLAQIDEAQKRIKELSETLIDLKTLLNDKRARGAFGEVQLATLMRNSIPEQHFALQYTLSNGKRVDCMLFLPAPTGHIAIDSKFPLENYQAMLNTTFEHEKKRHKQKFISDLTTHIEHISNRYIIANETADGAIMFIPAESIFAHIHACHPALVAKAQAAKVWLVSPTTMMAILTTATSVLKDVATRKQVHEIQKHLGYLSEDFGRFKKRMENLTRHIQQAHNDIQQVQTSSDKIIRRFDQIEQVDLHKESRPAPAQLEEA